MIVVDNKIKNKNQYIYKIFLIIIMEIYMNYFKKSLSFTFSIYIYAK